MNNEHTEVAVYHEVRIRLLEKIAEGIEKKMEKKFNWALGSLVVSTIIATTLFGGIIYTWLN